MVRFCPLRADLNFPFSNKSQRQILGPEWVTELFSTVCGQKSVFDSELEGCSFSITYEPKSECRRNRSSPKVLPNKRLIKASAIKTTTAIWLEKIRVCSKIHLLLTDFCLWFVCADKRQRGESLLPHSVCFLLKPNQANNNHPQQTPGGSLQGLPWETGGRQEGVQGTTGSLCL